MISTYPLKDFDKYLRYMLEAILTDLPNVERIIDTTKKEVSSGSYLLGAAADVSGDKFIAWHVTDDISSVKKAIKAVEAEGCKVVKVIVIVDRQEGGSDLLRKEGYNFEAIINLPPSGIPNISESSATEGEIKVGV